MAKKKEVKKDFSAGGIVYNSHTRQVLMIRVENLVKEIVWTFPKGHPEPHETDQHAAMREVQEETGWTTRIVQPLMDVRYSFIHKGVTFDKVVRWFLMYPVKKVQEFEKQEVIECEWVDLIEAVRRITYPSDRLLIEKLKILL